MLSPEDVLAHCAEIATIAAPIVSIIIAWASANLYERSNKKNLDPESESTMLSDWRKVIERERDPLSIMILLDQYDREAYKLYMKANYRLSSMRVGFIILSVEAIAFMVFASWLISTAPIYESAGAVLAVMAMMGFWFVYALVYLVKLHKAESTYKKMMKEYRKHWMLECNLARLRFCRG